MAGSILRGLTILVQLQLLLLVLFARSTNAGIIDNKFKRDSDSTGRHDIGKVFTKINSIRPVDPKVDLRPDGYYMVNATWELDIKGRSIRHGDAFKLTVHDAAAITLQNNGKFTDKFDFKLSDGDKIAECVINYSVEKSEATIECVITKFSIHYHYTFLSGTLEFAVSFNAGDSVIGDIPKYAQKWKRGKNEIQFSGYEKTPLKGSVEFNNEVDYSKSVVRSSRHNSKGSIIYFLSSPDYYTACPSGAYNVTYTAIWESGTGLEKNFLPAFSQGFTEFGYPRNTAGRPKLDYLKVARNGGLTANFLSREWDWNQDRFFIHGQIDNVTVSYGTKFKLTQFLTMACRKEAPYIYQSVTDIELRAFEIRLIGAGKFDNPETTSSAPPALPTTNLKELKNVFTGIDSIKPMNGRKGGPFDYYWANLTWKLEKEQLVSYEGDYFYLDMPNVFTVPVAGEFILGDTINNLPLAKCSVIQQGAGKKSSSKILCSLRRLIWTHDTFTGYLGIPIMFDGGGREDSLSLASKWKEGNNEVVFNGNLKATVNFPSIDLPEKLSLQIFTGAKELYMYYMTNENPCPTGHMFSGGLLQVDVDKGQMQKTSTELFMVHDVSPFGFPTEVTRLTPKELGGYDSRLSIELSETTTTRKRFAYNSYFTHQGLNGTQAAVILDLKLRCEGGDFEEGFYMETFTAKYETFSVFTKTTQMRAIN